MESSKSKFLPVQDSILESLQQGQAVPRVLGDLRWVAVLKYRFKTLVQVRIIHRGVIIARVSLAVLNIWDLNLIL